MNIIYINFMPNSKHEILKKKNFKFIKLLAINYNLFIKILLLFQFIETILNLKYIYIS